MRYFDKAAFVVALILAQGCAIGESAFKDPIDTPAAASTIAHKQIMLSITRVGERLFAVGQSGYIVSSSDAGKTWHQIPCPVSVDLVSIKFSSPMQGWITGHDGIVLRSTDGGNKWIKVLDGRAAQKYLSNYYRSRVDAGDASATAHLTNVEMSWRDGQQLPFLDALFEDGRRGIIVGPYGMIMETNNAGESWLPLLQEVENPEHLHLNMLRQIGTDLYIPSERGTLFRRPAGHSRFTPIKTGYTGTFFGVVGSSSGIVAYGLRGKAYLSSDNGKTWRISNTGTEVNLVADLTLPDGRLVLLAVNGALIVSSDGGDTFSPMGADHGVIDASMALASPTSLAVAGVVGIYTQPIK